MANLHWWERTSGGGGHYGDLLSEINQQGIVLGYAELNDLAAAVPAGSEGLRYCTGPSRTNPNRRRGFFGNTNKMSSIGHRARAVIEGVLTDLYEFYEVLQQHDQAETIIGAGKAILNSITWRQVTSDLFGKRLKIANTENAILGASLMAARGVKYFDGPRDWEYLIRYEEAAIPNEPNSDFYREHFVSEWKQEISQLSTS